MALDDIARTGTIVDAQREQRASEKYFLRQGGRCTTVRSSCATGASSAGGCMLPLSKNVNLSRDLGMRHRAGIGMSENSDAVVVIVSEETGTISVAIGGLLKAPSCAADARKAVNPEGNPHHYRHSVVFGEDVLREDQSLIITGGRTATVTAEFHGKNADLNKLLQQQDEITAVVDVTRIRTAKSYTMSYDLNLPNSVQDAGITVTSRSPSSITFEVQKQVSMPIEIRGDFTGVSVAEGYMLEKDLV